MRWLQWGDGDSPNHGPEFQEKLVELGVSPNQLTLVAGYMHGGTKANIVRVITLLERPQ